MVTNRYIPAAPPRFGMPFAAIRRVSLDFVLCFTVLTACKFDIFQVSPVRERDISLENSRHRYLLLHIRCRDLRLRCVICWAGSRKQNAVTLLRGVLI